MHRNEEVSYDEIVERLKDSLSKWQEKGLVEEVKEFTDKNDVRHCVIMFSKDFGSYRHFYTNDRMTGSGVLRLLGGVAMVIRL